jgi:hypothetical protein
MLIKTLKINAILWRLYLGMKREGPMRISSGICPAISVEGDDQANLLS